jgi:hypothetical protein
VGAALNAHHFGIPGTCLPINNQTPPDTSRSSVFENDATGSLCTLNSFLSLADYLQRSCGRERTGHLLKVIDRDPAPSDRS